MADSIERMFVSAIREGITRGFEQAVENTIQDSSNAATHWMVGVEGKGNIYSRKYGKLRDLRGGKDPLVGNKGDGRGSGAVAASVVKAVVDREVSTVLKRYAQGQKPELGFYFYNAVASDSKYDFNTLVSDAGQYGIEYAKAYFDREIELGNTRRNRIRSGS